MAIRARSHSHGAGSIHRARAMDVPQAQRGTDGCQTDMGQQKVRGDGAAAGIDGAMPVPPIPLS
jgi:hypothetical protein